MRMVGKLTLLSLVANMILSVQSCARKSQDSQPAQQNLANMERANIQQSPEHTFRIVIIGDSLTEGYGVAREQAFPALLEQKINQQRKATDHVRVINAGIGGSTTASGVQRLRWHLQTPPQILMIALGANDGLRGVQLEQSQKHLQEMIQVAQDAGIANIILAGMLLPLNYGKDYRQQFQNMYQDLSKKNKLPLLPFLLEGVGGVTEMNLTDGIHPNERGHQKIAETVYEFLKPYY